MLDYHVDATDGVQGTVQDFLFDDESWIVHYLVAETASPLGKREGFDPSLSRCRKADWEMKRLPHQPDLSTDSNLSAARGRSAPLRAI